MNRQNQQKESFLQKIPACTIESSTKKFTNIAFNFQFFDNSQIAGQKFSDWNHGQLIKLLDKLKNYCSETIEHWEKTPIGQGAGHVLVIYGNFPSKSDFIPPKHVPIDAKWGRFRLESDMRLVGFIIDPEKCILHKIPDNIFYVVFLDANHRFCKSE
jgi:hypothetical protein